MPWSRRYSASCVGLVVPITGRATAAMPATVAAAASEPMYPELWQLLTFEPWTDVDRHHDAASSGLTRPSWVGPALGAGAPSIDVPGSPPAVSIPWLAESAKARVTLPAAVWCSKKPQYTPISSLSPD